MAEFAILNEGDELINRVVPDYSIILDTIVLLLPAPNGGNLKILDLGAGSGRISEVIHRELPAADLTLLDISDEMLAVAKRRLDDVRAAFVTGDYTSAELETGFDVIVASLTLHHLPDPQKRDVFVRLYSALADGGSLVISDIVLGSTPYWSDSYEELWLEAIQNVPEEQRTHILKHYREHDIPASVADQLAWLSDVGFIDVACHWRRLNFAVYGGRKVP